MPSNGFLKHQNVFAWTTLPIVLQLNAFRCQTYACCKNTSYLPLPQGISREGSQMTLIGQRHRMGSKCNKPIVCKVTLISGNFTSFYWGIRKLFNSWVTRACVGLIACLCLLSSLGKHGNSSHCYLKMWVWHPNRVHTTDTGLAPIVVSSTSIMLPVGEDDSL